MSAGPLAVLPLPDLAKPLRDALILRGRMNGKSVRDVAKEADCSPTTVHRIQQQHEDWMLAERREMQKKVLEGFGTPTHARMADASNPESRTGAQSYVALLRFLGWYDPQTLIQAGDTHIHGDVNVDASDRRALHLESVELRNLRDAHGTDDSHH